MKKDQVQKVLKDVMNNDINNIQNALDNLDVDAFETAVETLLKARKIYIVGVRESEPLAEILKSHLQLIFDNVVLVTTQSAYDIFEQLLYMGEKDAVIGISFPRYSLRTIKALEFANNRNAKVITLTDHPHSPITLYSSCNLAVSSSMTSVTESMAAPLSVVNALITALLMRRKKKVTGAMQAIAQISEEYGIYGSDELNCTVEKVTMKNKGTSYE